MLIWLGVWVPHLWEDQHDVVGARMLKQSRLPNYRRIVPPSCLRASMEEKVKLAVVGQAMRGDVDEAIVQHVRIRIQIRSLIKLVELTIAVIVKDPSGQGQPRDMGQVLS